MDFLSQLVTWINIPINALAGILLAPIAVLPGWLSNTIISAIFGVILLIIFKYTSDQRAIGRVKDNIKANILAMRLFKDSLSVSLLSQGRVFKGSFLLLFYSLRPLLVMVVPVSLLLAQLSLWYQCRPLLPQEEAIVTIKFKSNIDASWPDVNIEPAATFNMTMGPIRIASKREMCWKIKGLENGSHRILFNVNQQQIEKELAIGRGFMRISIERPRWYWADIIRHPREKPFHSDSIVESIRIAYPERLSRICGTDWWLIYFFIASLVFALIFKPFLKVRI